jgi:glycosyltransferase involved in cell wall biosynthesis
MDDIHIILPVYNERHSITTVIDEWCSELNKYHISYKLIICEDGSTDGTKELLVKLKLIYPILLNQCENRRGYAGAVISGIQSSNSSYVLCIDSDGQCDPKDFIHFWNNRDSADILIGWRQKRADTTQRKLFSFCFKSLFGLLFPNKIHDPSAPYVLFRKKVIIIYIQLLILLKEGFWWGFIACALKYHKTICELPIHHKVRMNGATNVYLLNKIPSIAVRNIIGLFRIKFCV